MKIKLLQTTKRAFPTFVLMLLVVAGLTLSCVSCKSKACQQDYEQLSMTEFHSLSEAQKAIGDFLSKYEDSKRCTEYCDKVRQMKVEFEGMEKLFTNIDNSDPEQQYCEFIATVNSKGESFSKSSYEIVRKTWNYLENEKKDAYLRKRLDKIDDNLFKSYLESYAVDIASRLCGSKYSVDDYYTLKEQIETTLDETGGELKKIGSCIVHVDMVKERFLLPDKWGYVEIRVEGAMSISDFNCKPCFAKGSIDKYKDGMPERIDWESVLSQVKIEVKLF